MCSGSHADLDRRLLPIGDKRMRAFFDGIVDVRNHESAHMSLLPDHEAGFRHGFKES